MSLVLMENHRAVQPAPARNFIREALAARNFFWTLEFVPSADKVLRDQLNQSAPLLAAAGHAAAVAGFSVSDRVHSDRDPDPVATASHIASRSG
ncbi:hypothetical protein [Lacisediminimonas sp.]|uniref:hypothetical protein n=1 Tax=Lacisediminimonas sp. TaxID=3060582 RepID=UPI00271C99EE|nr:hypothetical protein [Lacisediminimonas sp.]MDO8300289.1 hypothetical protein [Lacisediminimonas sp.]